MRFLSVFFFWLWLLLLPLSGQAAELALTFFNIGQGDAALIVSPTGKHILIDGGPPEGTEALLAGLSRRNIDRIDLILLSHPHLDHLGGLRKVIERKKVELFMDAGYPNTSPAYTALLRSLSQNGVPVKQATLGRIIEIGDGATLRLLGPPNPWLERTRSDVNANSLIVRLSWRGRTALFSGDAEPETEQWLLAQYSREPALLQAEVLKVPHHGGKYSSTAAFVAAVQPRWSVISVATVNDYHHPTPEAMGRLQKTGAQLLRTDELGAITLRSVEGQPWQLATERSQTTPTPVPASTPAPAPAPAPTSTMPVAAPARMSETGNTSASGYSASRSSQVFHRANCSIGKQIAPQNLLRFHSRDEALASGRRPAEDCQP